MTIGDQYSSFSQYYQEASLGDLEKQKNDNTPKSQTYRNFLRSLHSEPNPENRFNKDSGYLSEDDSENSLDDFIVPDDYPIETMSESDEEDFAELVDSDYRSTTTDNISKRKSLPRASKNKSVRKRYREDDLIPQQISKRKKTTAASNPNWIRFRRSVEYFDMSAGFSEEGSYKIHGRDEIVQRIMRLVTQESGGIRPLLIGPPNIGKCGVVKHLAENLAKMKSKSSLFERSVVMLDCQAVVSNWIASVDELQIAMVVRQKVSKLLKNHANPIVYFRNIDAFLKYDESTDFLRSFFRQPINMIASISEDEKSAIVGKCEKILAPYNFKTVTINECAIEHMPAIIMENINAYPFPYKNITLSEKALLAAIKLADKHIKDRPFPIKAINLIRETASYVYHSEVLSSRKRVIKPEDIAEVVHQETGITVKELMANSLDHLVNLEIELNKKIVGQEKAIKTVCSLIKQSRIGLGVDDKPAGVFLFVGPTGVGKTLLAQKLAEGLFHDKQAFHRINMEGYSAPTSLSKLIGTDPGYVGYEQVGSLDGKISRRPNLIVLLDEIEKAHEDVKNYLLGVCDTGFMENGKGKKIDCRNVIFIMTSNVGAKELLEASKEKDLDESDVLECVDAPLKDNFRSEFLNRMDEVVPFLGLKEEECPNVARVHLEDIKERYLNNNRIDLSWSQSVIDYFSHGTYCPEFGMRNLGKTVNKLVGKAVTNFIQSQGLFISGKVHLDVISGTIIAN